jgi:hypothetical protein
MRNNIWQKSKGGIMTFSFVKKAERDAALEAEREKKETLKKLKRGATEIMVQKAVEEVLASYTGPGWIGSVPLDSETAMFFGDVIDEALLQLRADGWNISLALSGEDGESPVTIKIS